MFGTWRIRLREAEEAFREGRLDAAGRLIEQGELKDYLPGQRLAADVAAALAARAKKQARVGDSAAGWKDLAAAARLVGDSEPVLAARRELTSAGLTEAESYLLADDPAGAVLRIEQLEKHGAGGERLRTLKEVVRRLERAKALSRTAKFADAEQQLAGAAALRPDLEVLARRREDCGRLAERARGLTERLHHAQTEQNWSKTLSIACELLEIAPQCPVGRAARKKAWGVVGAEFDSSQAGASAAGIEVTSRHRIATAVAEEPPGEPRFLLWVDAVGGYLVCLGDVVTIGQSFPGNRIDVPIQGDLSRRHAVIRREGEGYLVEPLSKMTLEGRPIEERQLLRDGDELEMGGVRLRFRKPHALSASARLEFVSRHHTQPTTDAVLLMAESCVLGPKWQNHVVCRDWPDDVVLFRHEGEMFCRTMGTFEVDGRLCDGRGRLTLDSRVCAPEFSMSLEEC